MTVLQATLAFPPAVKVMGYGVLGSVITALSGTGALDVVIVAIGITS